MVSVIRHVGRIKVLKTSSIMIGLLKHVPNDLRFRSYKTHVVLKVSIFSESKCGIALPFGGSTSYSIDRLSDHVDNCVRSIRLCVSMFIQSVFV
jgi:hypothetical protein